MHIKNIHCIIEKLAETTKVELDKGIENVDTKEMGEIADIIKDFAEAEYYAKISKAMDEAEYEDGYADTVKVTEPYIELVNSDDYETIEVFRDCKAAKNAEHKAIEQGLNVYLSYR